MHKIFVPLLFLGVYASWQPVSFALEHSVYIPRGEFVPQHDKAVENLRAPSPLNRPLADYYQAIKSDGVVNMYYGLGMDHYHSDAHLFFHAKLKEQFTKDRLTVDDLRWEDRDTLAFTYNAVRYFVRLGNERNEFAEALNRYEVVMYGGHSRYGVGPVFQSYDSYFRMGYDYSSIEVDTRNPYFKNEKILEAMKYPVKSISFPEGADEYQYRGVKEEYSKLPSDSYTIRIEGNGRDLRDASFLPGKQLFLLKSCSNVYYWKTPLRAKFPDSNEKLFFGTNEDTHGKQDAFVVFIAAVMKETSRTTEVISALNKTNECGTNCFTAY